MVQFYIRQHWTTLCPALFFREITLALAASIMTVAAHMKFDLPRKKSTLNLRLHRKAIGAWNTAMTFPFTKNTLHWTWICHSATVATNNCDALLTISLECTIFISAEEVSRQTKNIPMEEDSLLLKSYHKVQISRLCLQSKLCRQDKTRTHKYPIFNAIIFYCQKSNQK